MVQVCLIGVGADGISPGAGLETPGACTVMVDEQIQIYRISFELNKPLQSGFGGTTKLIINFLFQLRLDPELMAHMHMNV